MLAKLGGKVVLAWIVRAAQSALIVDEVCIADLTAVEAFLNKYPNEFAALIVEPPARSRRRRDIYKD